VSLPLFRAYRGEVFFAAGIKCIIVKTKPVTHDPGKEKK
jgi:hypothetical protein